MRKHLPLFAIVVVCLLALAYFLMSSVLPKPQLVLDYTRSGGFAGLCDHLQVTSDNRFTYIDECHQRTSTGSLTVEEISQLRQLIDSSGYIDYTSPSHPGTYDDIYTSLKFYGANTSPNQDATQLSNLISQLLARIKLL